MKTNLTILKGLLEGSNFEVKTKRGRGAHSFDVIYTPNNDVIATIDKELFEEHLIPTEYIKELINEFYTNHPKAQKKEIAISVERQLNATLRKVITKNRSDEEILDLVKTCKELKQELKDMNEDLLYTKLVAKELYGIRDKELELAEQGLL